MQLLTTSCCLVSVGRVVEMGTVLTLVVGLALVELANCDLFSLWSATCDSMERNRKYSQAWRIIYLIAQVDIKSKEKRLLNH